MGRFRTITALHEASHAVCAKALGLPIDRLSILGDATTEGTCFTRVSDERRYVVTAAGAAGAAKFCKDHGWPSELGPRGADGDFDVIAEHLGTDPQSVQLMKNNRMRLFNHAGFEALVLQSRKILDSNWPLVLNVADALQVRDTLFGAELQTLLADVVRDEKYVTPTAAVHSGAKSASVTRQYRNGPARSAGSSLRYAKAVVALCEQEKRTGRRAGFAAWANVGQE